MKHLILTAENDIVFGTEQCSRTRTAIYDPMAEVTLIRIGNHRHYKLISLFRLSRQADQHSQASTINSKSSTNRLAHPSQQNTLPPLGYRHIFRRGPRL